MKHSISHLRLAYENCLLLAGLVIVWAAKRATGAERGAISGCILSSAPNLIDLNIEQLFTMSHDSFMIYRLDLEQSN